MKIVTLEERPDLLSAMNAPELTPGPKSVAIEIAGEENLGRLEKVFPAYQVMLLDEGRIVAKGYSIPFSWDEGVELPDEGWDCVVVKGFADHDAKLETTALCALWIVVASDKRNTGLSSQVLEGLRSVASDHGLPVMYAPVRPSRKSEFPLIPLEDYVEWTLSDGQTPFDPWLRVHLRAGGRIMNVCTHSMETVGTIADWESATGLPFPGSGDYIVPGALAPVHVDVEHDFVTYVEPNVWVRHETTRPSASSF